MKNGYRVRKKLEKLLVYIFLICCALAVLIPIYMIISSAFKPTLEIKQIPPKLFFKPTLTHFWTIVNDGFLSYFKNTLIITGTNMVISVLFGFLAAYGLLLAKGKWAARLSDLIMLGKLLPTIAIVIPYYIILNKIGLGGSYAGPILAHAAINLPFVIWLMLAFMRELPGELLDAAKIDGCSRLTSMTRIIVPLLSPAIGSAVLLTTQYSWNELLFNVVLTSSETYPLTVGIARYVGGVSIYWGKSCMAATMVLVPVVVLGFLMQKYMVRGLTAGAVKG